MTRIVSGNLTLFAVPGRYRLVGTVNGLPFTPLEIVVDVTPSEEDADITAALATIGGKADLTAVQEGYVSFGATAH